MLERRWKTKLSFKVNFREELENANLVASGKSLANEAAGSQMPTYKEQFILTLCY